MLLSRKSVSWNCCCPSRERERERERLVNTQIALHSSYSLVSVFRSFHSPCVVSCNNCNCNIYTTSLVYWLGETGNCTDCVRIAVSVLLCRWCFLCLLVLQPHCSVLMHSQVWHPFGSTLHVWQFVSPLWGLVIIDLLVADQSESPWFSGLLSQLFFPRQRSINHLPAKI